MDERSAAELQQQGSERQRRARDASAAPARSKPAPERTRKAAPQSPPERADAALPPAPVHEPVCFVCKESEPDLRCASTGCVKAYHARCVGLSGREAAQLSESGAHWACGWHRCREAAARCEAGATAPDALPDFRCLTCPGAWSARLVPPPPAFVAVPGCGAGLCAACQPLVLAAEAPSGSTGHAGSRSEAAQSAFCDYWRGIKARWPEAVALAGGPRPKAGDASARVPHEGGGRAGRNAGASAPPFVPAATLVALLRATAPTKAAAPAAQAAPSAAAAEDDDVVTPVPSPSAALHPPDSPDEAPDDDAVARRWLRRSDLAPLRDLPDFGPLVAGFFVRVQQASLVPPGGDKRAAPHALLQVRSVRYRSRAYELLTARAVRGGRPEYAFQELVLEDDSVVTLNSVSNRPLGAPEVEALRARVAAGALRWPCGSRAARAALEAAAAALVAEKEARAAARLHAKAAEVVAAAVAPAPAAAPHPDTGIDEYGQMDVGAVLSKINADDDAPLLPPVAEPTVPPQSEPLPPPLPPPPPPPLPAAPLPVAPVALQMPLPPWVRPPSVAALSAHTEGSVPPPPAALAPAPADIAFRAAPPPLAYAPLHWEAAAAAPPARAARDRTASPVALPARVDPYAGTALGGAERHLVARIAAAAPPPPREWHRRSRERSRSPPRQRSRTPPLRYRSPSPRRQPSRSRSRSRFTGRDARKRSRERANGWDARPRGDSHASADAAGRSSSPSKAAWADRPQPKKRFPTYGTGKIPVPDWRKPTVEMLARDAAIKAQRSTGELYDPSIVLLADKAEPALGGDAHGAAAGADRS